jgi:hypothetical protein
MKRLRHPVRAIREPFGTAGLIVACVALVLALTGAAFAAAGLTGKQKKEVEKIAKKYAGKPGAAGAAGPAGPQGPAGAAGKDGANGTNGTDGTNGSNGQSVTLGTATGCGVPGGTKLTVGAASKEVCNGEEGEKGPKGDKGDQGDPGNPWTAGGTLPEGAQLTGVWTAHADASDEVVVIPLSFPIPLAEDVEEQNIYYGSGEESEIEIGPGVFEKTAFQKHCENASVIPHVAPGNNRTLCVYVAPLVSEPEELQPDLVMVSKSGGNFNPGASRAGGILKLKFPEPSTVYGSFAVSGG